MIQPVGGEAGAGDAVLPEPLVDDDEAEVLAERLDHLEQDFVRREHDIGLFGWRLLRLIVASLVERAARLLVLADSAFHLRADLERGLYRLDIAAHRLVRAELGAFAALPDCRGDAAGHLAARLVRQPMRRHGVQNTVRQSFTPWLGWTSNAPPPSSRARSASHPAIWETQRRGYSSSGMLKRSIRSGRSRLMNHGTYSAKCSLDSVTK